MNHTTTRRRLSSIALALLLSVVALGGAGVGAQPSADAVEVSAAHQLFLPLIASGQQPSAPPAPAPSDQELIAAALSAGTIDYGSSLLYRAYALFADPRLPSAFQGAGSEGEDAELFVAMADPSLSPAHQAALRPFRVRPSDPESVHSSPQAAASVASSDIFCVENGWASLRSAQPNVAVTVHARCGLAGAEADMRKALAIIEGLWGPMTQLMGKPLGDVGGQPGSPDDTIDIFLVEPLGSVWRDGFRSGISKGALHTTVAAPPEIALRSSAYVILARSDVPNRTFKSSVAHELFHVLQSAHNNEITTQNSTTWWFTEASAVWAESYFARETSREAVHGYFTSVFLPSRSPLHRSLGRGVLEDRKLMYASYIWPLFMEQERGPEAMGRVWRALAEVGTDWDAGMQAIAAELPFKDHFHRFALRNLNSQFFPDNPLGKRYVNLDAGFPDEEMPRPEVVEQLTGLESAAPVLTYPVELPALKAQYYHFSMADSVQQVRFDFSAIGPQADRKVSALVKLKGQPWELRENLPDVLTFCIEEEPLEDIWIVVSNHSTAIGPVVSGPLSVRPLKAPCACSQELFDQIQAVEQWRGTISFTYSVRGSDGVRDISQQRTSAISATLNLRTADGTAFLGSPTGVSSIDDVTMFKDKFFSGITGSGQPVPYDADANNYSRVGLSLSGERCQYHWNTTVYINAIVSSPDSSQVGPVDIGSLGSGWRPLTGLVLAGSEAFPAHSTEYILANGGPFYEQPDVELVQILGEDGIGTATVSWHFTPVDMPPSP
jgi:hypothetical protein